MRKVSELKNVLSYYKSNIRSFSSKYFISFHVTDLKKKALISTIVPSPSLLPTFSAYLKFAYASVLQSILFWTLALKNVNTYSKETGVSLSNKFGNHFPSERLQCIFSKRYQEVLHLRNLV